MLRLSKVVILKECRDLSAVAVERVPRAARHVPHTGEGADGVVASIDVQIWHGQVKYRKDPLH